MTKFKILKGKQTTEDYPYGRLRCTRHSWIEYRMGKGYRRADQTINPKTGRINKPKKTIYYDYLCLFEEENTGYTKTIYFSFNDGMNSVQKFKEFLIDNVEQLEFTKDQSQDLWAKIIATIKISAEWTTFKKSESEKPTFEEFFDRVELVKILNFFKEKKSILELGNIKGNFVDILNSLKEK